MDEDKILQMLLKHGEDIEWIKENMSTKSDHSEVMEVLDVIAKLSEKKDQELTLVTADMKKHDNRLEALEKVVNIKPAAGLA